MASEVFIALFAMLGVSILVLLISHRAYRWPAYAALLVAVTLQYGTLYGLVGEVFAVLFFGVLFLTCNYAVKLVLDHRREIGQFWSDLSFREKVRSVVSTAPSWGAVLLLVGLGTMLHSNLADNIEEAYRAAFNIGSHSEELLLAQEDTLAGLQRSERQFLSEMPAALKAGRAESQSAAAAMPQIYAGYLERLRPAPIQERFCASWSFEVLRVPISFAWLCRGLVSAINEQIESSFNRVKGTTLASLERRIADLDSAGAATEDRLIAEATQVTTEAYAVARQMVNGVFLVGVISGWAGAAVVFYSVLAAFVLATARAVFDARSGRLTFQLVPREDGQRQGEANPTFHDEMNLLPAGSSDIGLTWYVSWIAKKSGRGTFSSLSYHPYLRCIFSRARTGRLSFSRLRFDPSEESIQTDPPKISVPGDSRIVLIKLEGHEELVFPMKRLVGFTEGVSLRSGYSAHVGNHFLGIGMFYTYATGTGYLALLTIGEDAKVAKPNSLHSAQAFLCWDRRQTFALEQNRNAFTWWVNAPSIKVMGESSAVLDEGTGKAPGAIAGFWKLARFLFLPI
ncbi:hypothetical protein [Variovorax sp. LjRoot178]|uniref:hypothetical protein n=1 Tax=Variovorax sp. LjRoot178 TaxID=3342277 RepID=UPI003ECE37FC